MENTSLPTKYNLFKVILFKDTDSKSLEFKIVLN